MDKSLNKYVPTPAELERIRNIRDEDIDFSDAPETDSSFWASAKMVSPKVSNNKMISMRYDLDLLEWLKNEAQNKGVTYQSLIHSILESYRKHTQNMTKSREH